MGVRRILMAALLGPFLAGAALAQTAPSDSELRGYRGLMAAAAQGDLGVIARLSKDAAERERRDGNGRTALHIATFQKQRAAVSALLAAGTDTTALDRQKYDAVTIASVADDPQTLKILLDGGASAKLITSIYDGTALIAAAHLGHDEVVRLLIAAGTPLDHVNNLGWTALMESIVLGNGGTRHQASLRHLLQARANPNIADRQGVTPLAHAKQRNYAAMVALLTEAGAR